jgi:hypothetical protein
VNDIPRIPKEPSPTKEVEVTSKENLKENNQAMNVTMISVTTLGRESLLYLGRMPC